MLATLKAVLNNCNQINYIKNINDIKLEKVSETKENSNNIVYEEGSKELIEKISKNNRTHNLNVFLSNYLSIRKYRFLYVSLPALLTAASALTFTLPSSVKINSEATKYTKESTIYSPDKGVFKTSEDAYDLNDLADLLNCQIVDNEDAEIITNGVDGEINLKMHNYEQAINASVDWKSDGNLEFSSFSSVTNYLDTNEFNDVDFEILEDDEYYVTLFDRVINIIKDAGITGKKDDALIDSLNDSEKREVVLSIISYNDPENVSVVLERTMWPEKLLSLSIAVIYCLYTIIIYYARKSRYSVYDYEIKNGYLYQKDFKRIPGNLFYETMKVKEAFQASERERILHLWDEIKKNVALSDQGKILTNYEKKLIKKYTNDNVPKK